MYYLKSDKWHENVLALATVMGFPQLQELYSAVVQAVCLGEQWCLRLWNLI